MISTKFAATWACLVFLLTAGCKIEYSFTGTTIDYNVTQTFSVANFFNDSGGGPANMGQLFTEELKDYFQRNTQLELIQNGGDLQLSGAITKYTITPQATVSNPNSNQPDRAGQMRITIGVEVDFVNLNNEEENSKRPYSFFQDYDPRTTSLLQVETELVEVIFENIIQDVFTSTVANW
ncbi:Lipopolysaccharide-assembly [Cyclobacterium lianum]|uniref:Lipopolysaccharide-assembly n=1 Tax=Cyclobacterium lianum TaxID=388280 RepID=A0A1M7P9Q7_9BACT|nr:LptE family protein [Cyclobacterium lianum]SHN13529.1 Lipopolysaccharide-assembly [Cyclobacterium lianum]